MFPEVGIWAAARLVNRNSAKMAHAVFRMDATNAAVVSAPEAEPEKPFPTAETNPFGVPIPAHGETHQEQTQQEDYLWGV